MLLDFKAYYNRKLVNIGCLVEEVVGVKIVLYLLLSKLTLLFEYYLFTGFGISMECYRGNYNKLEGTSQRFFLSRDIFRDKTYLIFKVIENED